MKPWLLCLLALPFAGLAQEKKMITLDDIYRKPTFRGDYIGGFSSLSDGRYYTEFNGNNLLRKRFEDGQTQDTIILGRNVLDDKTKVLDYTDFEWSRDEKKLLVFRERESIYRRSSKAFVYIYDIAGGKTALVDKEKIMHAELSPDGTKVGYVKDNNLYVKDLKTGKVTPITTDGKRNAVINGNCDWVYEEEFEFTKAWQWSESGANIAYYRFDESKVPTFTMTIYDSLYPTPYTYKYPKAGDPNSVVTIYTYNLATGKKTRINTGAETDVYIPRIKWTKDDNTLAFAWLNRLQNHLKWQLADARTGVAKPLYEERDARYVEINDDLRFLKDGKAYILSSEQGGYRDLYVGTMGGAAPVALIRQPYDIADLLGVDEKSGYVYFTSVMRGPTGRDFCRVPLRGGNVELIDQRVGTHAVSFTNDFTYYLNVFSNQATPPVYEVFRTADIGSANRQVRLLKNNQALADKLKGYALGQFMFLQIPNGKGENLSSWMLKPYNFDSTKKYPVLFCNYGGPGSQQVANRFGAVNFWQQMLSQQGYIIVCVDNTGTGFRGAEFKKKTYRELGKYEIEDQIAVGRLLKTIPYVDSSRIGHWGWSFGGFMSSLAITKGADVFKTAIAVAPVTSWRFYDNIYTERYMGLPKDNKSGYDDNAPLTHAGKIKGNFLIIHGTADDNVHFQNSVMMVDAMINKNIRFESAYYPNKNHGIRGGNTSYHLYSRMTDFLLKNL